MAKLVGALICLLIVAMDVMAGILGIEAEIAQNKVYHVLNGIRNVCFLICCN